MAATTSPTTRPSFSAPGLHEQIMRLRAVDNVTNLGYLAWEYLCIASVLAGAVWFCEYRGPWRLSWGWNVPVMVLAWVLLGALQHRLAGLGHEAAHYTLLRSKWANDLVGDLFCLFPILGTLHFYRVFHLAHHQFTNDPGRDPDLVSLGGSKLVDRFPMGRREFVRSIYLRAITDPVGLWRFQNDYWRINVVGSAENEYLKRVTGADGQDRAWPRLASRLGHVYLGAFALSSWVLYLTGLGGWIPCHALIGALVVLAVGAVLPARAFFPTPFRQPFSPRAAGILRMLYFTAFLTAMNLLREATGGRSVAYFWLLWFGPMATTFPFFMMLRDVYQHTNADDGRLTNSRVFLADPFSRWAVFVYGQGIHVTHHLFPAIPHYHLPRLHRLLKERHAEYAAAIVEVHGTFANGDGYPTILDVLCAPRPDRSECPGTGA